jgi:hypothetical protein
VGVFALATVFPLSADALVKRFNVNKRGVNGIKSGRVHPRGRTDTGRALFQYKAALSLEDGSTVEGVDVVQELDPTTNRSDYTLRKGDEVQATIATVGPEEHVESFNLTVNRPAGAIAIDSAGGVFVENQCENIGADLGSESGCDDACASSEQCVSLAACGIRPIAVEKVVKCGARSRKAICQTPVVLSRLDTASVLRISGNRRPLKLKLNPLGKALLRNSNVCVQR